MLVIHRPNNTARAALSSVGATEGEGDMAFPTTALQADIMQTILANLWERVRIGPMLASKGLISTWYQMFAGISSGSVAPDCSFGRLEQIFIEFLITAASWLTESWSAHCG